MPWLRVAAAALTSVLFTADFIIARTTGTTIDGTLAAAWLLALGWLFGGGIKDTLGRRNGNGGGNGDDRKAK